MHSDLVLHKKITQRSFQSKHWYFSAIIYSNRLLFLPSLLRSLIGRVHTCNINVSYNKFAIRNDDNEWKFFSSINTVTYRLSISQWGSQFNTPGFSTNMSLQLVVTSYICTLRYKKTKQNWQQLLTKIYSRMKNLTLFLR